MLLHDILDIMARQKPDETALDYVDGRSLTFSELHARVTHLAAGLSDLAPPGAHVAILADNCPEYLELYYAVPAAGLRLVFINYRLSPREIAHILTDSESSLLFYREGFGDLAREAVAKAGTGVSMVGIDRNGASDSAYEKLLKKDASPLPEGGDENDVAWIIYTSGTTGAPKGAMLTHRNLLSTLYNTALRLGPNRVETRRSLAVFPLCHIAAGTTVIECQLLGVPVVMHDAFSPEDWLDTVETQQITDATLAPTMINMLINHPGIETRDLSSLRTIYYGSSPISIETLQRAIDLFGNVFAQGYGMTEVAGSASLLLQGDHRRALEGEPHLLGAAGRPGPLTRIKIVDEAGRERSPGEAGEILIKGDLVFSGYWKNPEATAANLQGGWLHTGDVGTFDKDGCLYVLDRKKDMVISGGENVYTKEVEDVLYEHDDVVEAAVFGIPDERWGEIVCAAIVRREGAAIDSAGLKAHCRASLGGFKVPRRLVLVDELPRNVSGKVLKRALREQFSA